MIAAMLSFCMVLIDEPDDCEKFKSLYDRYKDDMFRAAYSILRDHSLSEDAVQDALIRIARVIKGIDMSRNPRSFVITVAKNTARDLVIANSHEEYSFDCHEMYYKSADTDVEKKIEQSELIEQLAHYIMTCKPEYYEIFVLKYFNGLSYKQITQVLGITNEAARKRVQRIREMLFDYLEGELI